MEALNNLISLVPGFNSDILIPAIPVLARTSSDEPTSDPSIKASANTLKAWVGKWKAAANLTPQKKVKKIMGRSAGGIKINEPAPQTPALTPPSGPRRKIPI
jgi:hypothetical protein